jgi:methylphosphotriester-DNA--protein-cysteine methyltransferase
MKKYFFIACFILGSFVFNGSNNSGYCYQKSENLKLNASISKTDTREDVVVFNVKTKKYHKASCLWAERCTRNCVFMKRSEALEKGGMPCKVCGE